MEYQIIAGDKDQVELGVRMALADGWKLQGSVAIANGATLQFAQAMILPVRSESATSEWADDH
jgi:hypothetical protein